MKYDKTKTAVIQKALNQKVTSENIAEKLDMEDIIYLSRMKNVMNCDSVESVLQNYISAYDIDREYKTILESVNSKEIARKNDVMEILHDALKEIPEEIAILVSVFLANALCYKFSIIAQMCAEIKNSKVCMDYIQKYEEKLGFCDGVTKINTLQYIKKKYSTPADYYYIDLIHGYTNSVLIALLYILYE